MSLSGIVMEELDGGLSSDTWRINHLYA